MAQKQSQSVISVKKADNENEHKLEASSPGCITQRKRRLPEKEVVKCHQCGLLEDSDWGKKKNRTEQNMS